MIQDRGVDAMINDSLIGNVLFMGTLLVGILSSLLGYLYLIIAKPAYNVTGNFTPLIMLICFIIGMSMFSTIATVITSGVTTTFVCLAEDPEALRRYFFFFLLFSLIIFSYRKTNNSFSLCARLIE